MDVLYRTNTIHIASAPLLHHLPDIMTPNVLSRITSLELVWNATQVPLTLGFTGQAASKSHKRQTEPLFPSLQVLRITFASLTWGELDAATGLNWPYSSKDTLASRLQTRLFPDIDALLDRIVPPSTDVTISCPKWIWYEVTDLALVEKQGKEATRPQRADIEGLKCWRETPSAATSGDKGLEEASGSTFRAGFWVHIPVEDVNLGTGSKSPLSDHPVYPIWLTRSVIYQGITTGSAINYTILNKCASDTPSYEHHWAETHNYYHKLHNERKLSGGIRASR